MRILVIVYLVLKIVDATPNLLFILADDLGYGDMGVYPNPNTTHGRLDTPNLNTLAKQSMMFTDGYAGAPVCAPSRCALMLGRHTGHCTVRDNGQSLKDDDITIATILNKAGYHTALVGKWGLGSNGTEASPNNKGFEYFYGYTSQENAHDYYPPFLWHNEKQIEIPANKNASTEKCGYPYTTHCVWAEDLMVNATLQYLEEAASSSMRPFYLFHSFTTPHAGGIGTDKETGVPAPYDLPQYSKNEWPQVEKDYASVVSMQDQHVGTILKKLEEIGLDKNTVVFYASDNGAHNKGGHSYKFFESSGPLRGFKRSVHEGGVRSPLLIRWPGVTKPGTVSEQQWGFWDFLQTAAEIAEVPTNSLPDKLDGYSLVPTLKGNNQEQPEYIYHEYCHPNEDHKGWGQGIRFKNWKSVRYNANDTTVELYDLEGDLSETNNLASQHPDVVKMAINYMNTAHVDANFCGH
ncbi:N-acetylgalactosamine-6-sulfatase-like [Dysidea avara]|uniref:N-acetylgalactosamine-6-sulfatase-like n=1 Tax=Dysidea avara TaxID=196820 RepID=UPI0033256013